MTAMIDDHDDEYDNDVDDDDGDDEDEGDGDDDDLDGNADHADGVVVAWSMLFGWLRAVLALRCVSLKSMCTTRSV